MVAFKLPAGTDNREMLFLPAWPLTNKRQMQGCMSAQLSCFDRNKSQASFIMKSFPLGQGWSQFSGRCFLSSWSCLASLSCFLHSLKFSAWRPALINHLQKKSSFQGLLLETLTSNRSFWAEPNCMMNSNREAGKEDSRQSNRQDRGSRSGKVPGEKGRRDLYGQLWGWRWGQQPWEASILLEKTDLAVGESKFQSFSCLFLLRKKYGKRDWIWGGRLAEFPLVYLCSPAPQGKSGSVITELFTEYLPDVDRML